MVLRGISVWAMSFKNHPVRLLIRLRIVKLYDTRIKLSSSLLILRISQGRNYEMKLDFVLILSQPKFTEFYAFLTIEDRIAR